ncbi:MAG: Ser/Thr protein kinase RdoA (MazF antagonist) [Limisphaerales bacterium]|jgi:Ser/Thr protein kinase RdoA (MazF antagonist)
MHWDEIPEHHHGNLLPEDNRQLFELYQKTISQINSQPKSDANYGLVHYDIHQGNYLLDEANHLILFDFEMTCKTWFINDIATVLYYACYYKNSAAIPNFEQIVNHKLISKKNILINSTKPKSYPEATFALLLNL